MSKTGKSCYIPMTLGQVIIQLENRTDKEFQALIDAVVPMLPSTAKDKMNSFTKEWNYCNPYEYFIREASELLIGMVRENLGRPVSFWGRILGKRVLTLDTVIKVREVYNV